MEYRTQPLERLDRLSSTLSSSSGAAVRCCVIRVFSYVSGTSGVSYIVSQPVSKLCILLAVLVILLGCVLPSKSGKLSVREEMYVLLLHFVVKTF
jgi:hypothetical protein